MRSAILTYHSIDESGSIISTAPAVFRAQMEMLVRTKIAVVPLSEIQNSDNSVAITFDDGFQNFEEQAWPLLNEFSFPVTVFLVSGYCGGYNEWDATKPALPRLPLMDWGAARRLTASRLEWGAHTVLHEDLTTLRTEEVKHALTRSREEIAQQTGKPVRSFAYPYGAVSERVRLQVKAEFDRGCGTRLSFLNGEDCALELPRIDAYYLRNADWISRLFQPSGAAYIATRNAVRDVRSWLFR